MKNRKLIPLIALALIGQACSSTPKGSSEAPSRKDVEPDYILRERSHDSPPQWAKDFQSYRDSNSGRGIHYFFGDSGLVHDRIGGCEFADLQSKRRIAQQIASLISSKAGSARSGQLFADVSGSENPGMRRHFEDVVAGESLAFLSGVRQQGTYWESRDYTKTGGLREVYLCSVLSAIDEQDLKNAVRRTAQRTSELVEDPEAKSAVKDLLKNLDQEMKNFIPRLSQ
jgi:hypothetical protein